MAGRTLPGKVVRRLFVRVAGLAVDGVDGGVVEAGRAPGGGGMAGRTLPGVVVGGPNARVAGLAIGGAHRLVVEGRRQPGVGAVAQRAFTAVVPGGAHGGVAGGAQIGRAGVHALGVAVLALQQRVRAGERVKGMHRAGAAGREEHHARVDGGLRGGGGLAGRGGGLPARGRAGIARQVVQVGQRDGGIPGQQVERQDGVAEADKALRRG